MSHSAGAEAVRARRAEAAEANTIAQRATAQRATALVPAPAPAAAAELEAATHAAAGLARRPCRKCEAHEAVELGRKERPQARG